MVDAVISRLNEDTSRQIITYAGLMQQSLYSTMNFRGMLATVDRAYMREMDYTKQQTLSRERNRGGDPNYIQNVTVPIVFSQTEISLSYFINVFLSGYPIFGIAGNPEVSDAALMLNTIVGENSTTARWIPELILFFRDSLKYNLGALEVYWGKKYLTSVSTDITLKNSSRKNVLTWNGNVIKRIDPYNMFFDTRVAPSRMHDQGEYFGYSELVSKVELISRLRDLPTAISSELEEKAISSQYTGGSISEASSAAFAYYRPLINPLPFNSPNMIGQVNWAAWAGLDKGDNKANTQGSYIWTRVYARIIPADFGFRVPGAKDPQVWQFDIINGQVVVTAERHSDVHNYIPCFMGQPFSDGLDLQTKSFASNVLDYQSLSSALWNGFLASKRRLVGDRVLYDPSRINKDDISSTNPAAKIPVRPSAYGRPIADSVHMFPYNDRQSDTFLSASEAVLRLANLVNNQNPAQQGQFVKGNKTLREYEDVMGHGNAGNVKMALTLEHQVFVPLKQVILLNMLLYQQDTVLYNPDIQDQVPIQAATIRATAAQFKVSDGMEPTSKLMGTEEMMSLFQLLPAVPQVAGEYHLGGLIEYILKLRSVDLRPFKKTPEEMQYEQQMGAWQQAAAMAAEKGAPFSTPMPQPPPKQPQPQSLTSRALAATAGGSTNG